MAELMQWKHFSRPIQDTDIEVRKSFVSITKWKIGSQSVYTFFVSLIQDDWLRSCADDIDFVFQTEIKKYC